MKSMNYLTVAQAAARAGLTERGIYDKLRDGSLVAHGGRNGIPADAVDEFIVNRQLAAAAKVGDPTRFAEQVRRRLQQPGGTRGTRTQLDKDALALLGPHVMRAAGMKESGGCKWCWARMTASVHGGLKPVLDDAHRLLLGEPCRQDLKAIRAELFAHHHKPDQTPADTTTHTRTAAAKPKTRPSPYIGNKRCGTPVGEWCACHPRSNPKPVAAAGTPKPKPKTKAKPLSRSEPHSCGCQCSRHRSQP